jgi:predicted nuclease of predicted toxin-antitoxin system
LRFIVDAHLPPGLCAVLRAAGHDALHTRQLTAQNRTADGVINEPSLTEQRVVVTNDADFYHSHLLQGRPRKLLFIRTGNLRTCALRSLLRSTCRSSWPRSNGIRSSNLTGKPYALSGRKAARALERPNSLRAGQVFREVFWSLGPWSFGPRLRLVDAPSQHGRGKG